MSMSSVAEGISGSLQRPSTIEVEVEDVSRWSGMTLRWDGLMMIYIHMERSVDGRWTLEIN